MARKPRIEFCGAIYHVMCRGNRQEAVFLNDKDNKIFMDTLAETCGRTGWRIHAFVLMGNHYHLLLETPEPNLVAGMRWLQGTYTQRFNIRHKVRGHLFQGRYKALLVDPERGYFSAVCSYIHLNPVRTKNFDWKTGALSDYLWSSFPLYLNPPKRPVWLAVDRTLSSLNLQDDLLGQTAYRQYMQKRVIEVSCSGNPAEADAIWKKIRRDWAFGSDGFRTRMQGALNGAINGKRRDSYTGGMIKRHDEQEAQRLLNAGLNKLGLKVEELSGLKKGDRRKKAIAWLIRRNTSVGNEWIAQNLYMGSVSNLSHQIQDAGAVEKSILKELA